MIRGAKYWNDKNRLYIQDNNAIETLVPGLEYCGPTMDVIAWDSLGGKSIDKNQYDGKWICQ